MDKKKLSKIILPEADENIIETFTENTKDRYLVTAEMLADNMLMLIIYKKSEIEITRKASFRVFMTEEDYCTQDFEDGCTKWKTGALRSILGYYYWQSNFGKQNIVLTTGKSQDVMNVFLKGYIEEKDKTIWEAVDRMQEKIIAMRLSKRHNKERHAIDEKMSMVGTMPDDLQTYLDLEVMKNSQYMIYSRKKKKAYCTGCHQESRLDGVGNLCTGKKVEHNQYGYCPCCGRYVQFKSNGMPRSMMLDEGWGVIIQKFESSIITRYVDVFKDYRTDYKKPELRWQEYFRTIHTKGKMYEYEWTQFHGKYEMRWCEIKNDRIHNVPRDVVLYDHNFPEVFQNTDFRYCMIDTYMDKFKVNTKSAWFVDRYLEQYDKYRFVEQLMKIGFYELARYFIEDHMVKRFDAVIVKEATTVPEILSITRNSFKILRQMINPYAGHLRIIQKAEQRGISLTEEDVLYLDHRFDVNKCFDLMRYTTLHKIKKYLDKADVRRSTWGDVYSDYFDYIRWIEELGYDMRNEFNLFPKNFQASHDRVMKEYEEYEEAKKKNELKKANVVIRQMFKDYRKIPEMQLKMNGLMIVVPEDGAQISKEGQALHHCVGTYVNKVAKGETLILFVRKEDEPEKPYFTMEWKGKIVQCRGAYNCSMTYEVQCFTKEFEKQMESWSMEKLNKRKRAS